MSANNINAIDEFGTRDALTIDGSETKLAAGVNTTLTGNGTAITPYIVDVEPKIDICYELTEDTTTTYDTLQYAWVQGQFDNGQFLDVVSTSPPTPGVVGTFAPITVHDGADWVAPATLQAELISKVLPLFQTQWPQLDSVKVSIDGSNTLFIDFYDNDDPTVDYSSNGLAIGGTGSQAFIFGPAFTDITSGGGPFIVREVMLNGQSAYYESNVLVTSSTRIAQIQALIAAAGASAVVLCDASDGSETKVIAGSNVTVTGTGTAANPYVVSALPDPGVPVLLSAKFAAKAIGPTAVEVTNYAAIAAESVTGTFNLTTGRFTAPVSGWYRVSASVSCSANWTSNQFAQINFLKNGTSFDISQSRATGGNLGMLLPGETIVRCVMGDQLSISLEAGQAATTASDSRLNEMHIVQIR